MKQRIYVNRFLCLLSATIFTILIATALLLVTSPAALAASGTVQDEAHVFDSAKVKAAADQLSAIVDIYTTKTFTGSCAPHHVQLKSMTTTESARFRTSFFMGHSAIFWSFQRTQTPSALGHLRVRKRLRRFVI